MREKGIDKYKSDYSSAVIKFNSLRNSDDFLTRQHMIRNRQVDVRCFDRGDDGNTNDDWDEIPSPYRKSRSSTRESHQSKSSFSRSSSASYRPSKRFHRSSSEADTCGTRTIMIRGYFSASEQQEIENYFKKLGPINRVTTYNHFLFIKFYEYGHAEKALGMFFSFIAFIT